jgi:uncharacterized RDD family membrane protein YckC
VHDPTNVLPRRFVAYFIDLALVFALSIAAFAVTKSESYSDVDIDDACAVLHSVSDTEDPCIQLGSSVYTWTGSRFALALLLSILAAALNHVLLQGTTGATVGKLMTGLRVVDPNGGRCGIGRAFVRWILLFVDQLFCAVVGLISVLTTHPHRRVGDMAASTYVIGTVDVGRPVLPPPPPYTPPVYPQQGYGGWQPPQAGAPSQWAPPQPGGDWGSPTQETAQQTPAPSWGAEPQSTWDAPAPAAPPTPPLPQPPQQPWGTPAPAPSPAPPAPQTPAGPPQAEPGTDSWWNKAVSDDANERDE